MTSETIRPIIRGLYSAQNGSLEITPLIRLGVSDTLYVSALGGVYERRPDMPRKKLEQGKTRADGILYELWLNPSDPEPSGFRLGNKDLIERRVAELLSRIQKQEEHW